MIGRCDHSNRSKLAMSDRCPYTEDSQDYDPGRGVGAILERKGASRTDDGTGAPANRGIS
jgi:hypothetical protein